MLWEEKPLNRYQPLQLAAEPFSTSFIYSSNTLSELLCHREHFPQPTLQHRVRQVASGAAQWKKKILTTLSMVSELTAFPSCSPQNGHRMRWIIRQLAKIFISWKRKRNSVIKYFFEVNVIEAFYLIILYLIAFHKRVSSQFHLHHYLEQFLIAFLLLSHYFG